MVSVCLPSDALLQHLPSYLGFSYLGHGVSLHSCSSKAQPLLLTLDEGYLLTATLPDLQRGIAPLGPPAPVQPWLLECGVGLPRHCPWLRAWGMGYFLPAALPDLGCGVTPLVTAPDLRHGVTPIGHSCAIAFWYSRPLPLTSDVGWLLLAAALLCLLVFALYIEVFLCWVHIYLQFLYLLPRLIPGSLWSILIFLL